MNPAGRADELGYQLALAALELRRDMEASLTQNNVTATSPRALRGLVGWAGDNVDGATAGTAYVAPDYVNNVAQTDGTQIAFTEARLKNVLQKCFTAGGEPDTLLLGPGQKQTFSTFSGNGTRMIKGENETIYAGIDVYRSDFGELKAIPSRFQRSRDVWALQADKWAVCYLRPFQTIELAKTGDADQRELVVEYTLEARSPKANGAVVDCL